MEKGEGGKKGTSKEPAISIANIRKSYGPIHALRGINFSVSPNEKVTLLGDNGAGKSTLLKIIVGLLTPDLGDVLIQGRSSLETKNDIGYLPEDATPYFNLTVADNPIYIAALRGVEEIDKRIEYLLEILGLSKYYTMRSGKLSRGNRQKLSIALALLHKPEIMVLDEPLNYLNIPSQESVIDLLENEASTLLVSTHNLSIARRLTDRLILIGEGNLIWDGYKKELEGLAENEEPLERVVSRMISRV